MPLTYEEKCFVKIHGTICTALNSLDLNRVNYAVRNEGLCSRACVMHRIPIFNLDDSKTVRTCCMG